MDLFGKKEIAKLKEQNEHLKRLLEKYEKEITRDEALELDFESLNSAAKWGVSFRAEMNILATQIRELLDDEAKTKAENAKELLISVFESKILESSVDLEGVKSLEEADKFLSSYYSASTQK
jgi:hypothetical protein